MSSSAPAAVSYFLTLAQTTLPDCFVVFRKRLGVFSAPLTLQVFGFTGTEEPAELSPEAKREENFDINCNLSSYAGDEDMQARMNEVMSAWSLLTIAVSTDYTLGGTVRWAQIPEYDFTPDTDTTGKSLGSLDFKVNCQQRITSLS